MAIQQKAVAVAKKESQPVSDDRLRIAAYIAKCLRDAGFECEVAVPLSIH